MDLRDFFILWQDIGLFLYAILKAFLPLPSLEVILVPLCLANMNKWLVYSLEGAVGTFIGGAIGYFIAYHSGRKIFINIAGKKDVETGERLMEKYGLFAVFIGGITPIPDFLLAYLAGLTKMRFLSFATCDALARFIRSVVITYTLKIMGTLINVDAYGTILSGLLIVWLIWRWAKNKKELRKEYSGQVEKSRGR